MASDLPDVNVWIALSHPDHAHHHQARSYWSHLRANRLALSRPTLFGLLRGLTNPKVMGKHLASPAKAWSISQTFLTMPDIAYIEDSTSTDTRVGNWANQPFFTHNLWTDAWIAAIAMEQGCRLVSFDADFAKFPGLNFLQLVP
ncbi:TA system VapC family ribonuclease toxin [Haloferula sp. BvORR071]|uniref:TA system VapC family ribonuclease toxin n=1 Tax=Haloferula sp. BvORR071 TaxID=1396141 RepID=UPI00054E27C7|nr:TA system VapC family ribonuclease toxin [Haloferula sp. BvORR071]